MKKILTCLFSLLILAGCTASPQVTNEDSSVYYEIFVRSFYDTNDDGIGDFNGVTKKLDYLQDLGVGGIWLMPIMPSPTYHKYDVTDYMNVDPSYGTLDDFKNLVIEAKEHNIDIMIDLVLNHSSSEHPWFLEAKQHVYKDTCNETIYCDYYNISDEKKANTYALGKKFYEAVFVSEMPDLNLDNENVRNEIKEIVKFWLDLGVKGFRLDATTHYYEGNTSKNTEFLQWLDTTVKEIREDAYIVGEAWTGEGIILDQYDSGIDSFFNFSLATGEGDIVTSIRKSDGKGLAQSIAAYQQAIKQHSSTSVDAPFLSNHDNARSYNYFTKDEQRKLASSIYLLLPGQPFIYYGEEIGLKGSGIDENKRLAFLWDDSKEGQCLNPSAADYEKPSTVTLEDVQNNENSLYNHMKAVIEIRNQHDFRNASIEAIDTGINEIMMLKVTNDEETLYVIHNLGKETQTFESRDVSKLLHSLEVATQANKLSSNTITIHAYSTMICE